MSRPVPQAKMDALYAWLVEVAAKGEPCPTNEAIETRMDVGSVAVASRMMARLAEAGLIRLERFQCGRAITVLATGQMTAAPKSRAPHWRDRPDRAAAHAARKAKKTKSAAREVHPPGVPAAEPAAAEAVAGAGAEVLGSSVPVPLAERVRAEAAEAGGRRRLARNTGTVRSPVPFSPVLRGERAARIASGDLSDAEPNEVLAFVRRRWPTQYARAAALAPELGCLPGEAVFRAIEAGLDCLETCEGEAA